jgi:glycosyltransferase involved in cell wall biosynthesis
VYFDQAARFAREIDARVVVTTHGMLYEHNLAQRPLRKRAARWLYQDRVLHEAACLHATADEDAEGIRRHGFEAPIAVLPWGVDVPPGSAVQRADRPRTVVYMGRLHPLKRLDTLVRAWAAVQANAPGWSLAFAGAAEQGYDGTLEALAADAGVAATVRFDGLLHGAARERAFADAAVVVQPSPAENFSLAIAEALSRGVPAIATHGAPWRALEAQRCGWWIEPGAEPLARALREAIVMSDDERRAMGERARRYARAQFDWETVADRTIEMYEWTLGRGSQPEFVHSS